MLDSCVCLGGLVGYTTYIHTQVYTVHTVQSIMPCHLPVKPNCFVFSFKGEMTLKQFKIWKATQFGTRLQKLSSIEGLCLFIYLFGINSDKSYVLLKIISFEYHIAFLKFHQKHHKYHSKQKKTIKGSLVALCCFLIYMAIIFGKVAFVIKCKIKCIIILLLSIIFHAQEFYIIFYMVLISLIVID